MTSDQRKTLEAMADYEDGAAEEAEDFQGAIPLAEEYRRGAAAIRAALAEVDTLTQQVATLNRDRALMHADRIVDAATIADLEARAIPKALASSDRVTLQFDQGDRTDVIQTLDGTVRHMWDDAAGHGHADFPTLSAALSAAKEAT